MHNSVEFVEYILELLAPLGDIQTTKMFGGVLLKIDTQQLGIIISDTLYFKVIDEGSQKEWKKSGSKQFTYKRKDIKEPVVIKNWWSVPDRAMDDREYMIEIANNVINN